MSKLPEFSRLESIMLRTEFLRPAALLAIFPSVTDCLPDARRRPTRPASVSRIAQLLAGATLALLSNLLHAPAAEAQWYLFDQPSRPKYRQIPADTPQPRRARRIEAPTAPVTSAKPPVTAARKAPTPTPDQDRPSVPLFAVVSIEDQHVSIYGSNGLIERSDVSTGTSEHPTPTGVFAIIQKERWHESNLYSSAPMPFMQRITWSGVAMHTGHLPGYPASHGCIRLPGSFAEQWYRMTKLGLRVLISPTDLTPAPFAHPGLPVPRYWSDPAVAALRKPVQSAALSNEAFAALAAPDDRAMNPIEYAITQKAVAKADLKQSEKDEGLADEAVETATHALKDTTARLKSAERDAASAEDRLAWFGLIGNRPPPSPRANFGDGIVVALANFEAANTRLSDARRADSLAKATLEAAKNAAKAADERTEALKTRIADLGRRQETVSIFISLKDERLYVRQALRPVFDVPVTFADPDSPVGTHVFVAAAPVLGEKALRWTALSMPVEPPRPSKTARSKRSGDGETASIGRAVFTENAAGALSRVQLPGEVMDQLSELVWAGASLIISDHGITHETGVGTDFIIETKH